MSSSVQIRKVDTKTELKRYIEFPWTLYQSDPNWVPPLLSMRAIRWLAHAWRRADESWSPGAELRVVPGLNGALRAVLALERRLLRRVSLPWGTSILAVAARPVSE